MAGAGALRQPQRGLRHFKLRLVGVPRNLRDPVPVALAAVKVHLRICARRILPQHSVEDDQALDHLRPIGIDRVADPVKARSEQPLRRQIERVRISDLRLRLGEDLFHQQELHRGREGPQLAQGQRIGLLYLFQKPDHPVAVPA